MTPLDLATSDAFSKQGEMWGLVAYVFSHLSPSRLFTTVTLVADSREGSATSFFDRSRALYSDSGRCATHVSRKKSEFQAFFGVGGTIFHYPSLTDSCSPRIEPDFCSEAAERLYLAKINLKAIAKTVSSLSRYRMSTTLVVGPVSGEINFFGDLSHRKGARKC